MGGDSIKTLIAIPAMSTVHTDFMKCFTALRRVGETRFGVTKCSMIHDARNEFASKAIMGGYDRVLWLDSDMVFEPDLMERLSADMDEYREYVSALAFKRVFPTSPVIYKRIGQNAETGLYEAETYKAYPKDELFRVAGSGFGAVMTSVNLLKQVWDKYGPPFFYHANLGEDISFCYRVNELGMPMYCDSRVKVGHIGNVVFDESVYDFQTKNGRYPSVDDTCDISIPELIAKYKAGTLIESVRCTECAKANCCPIGTKPIAEKMACVDGVRKQKGGADDGG